MATAHAVRTDAEAATVVGSSVQSLRRKRGLTLAELAVLTGYDKGYLSRIERGLKSPSVAALLKIAAALQVQVSHLFGESTVEDAIKVVRRDAAIAIPQDRDSGATLQVIMPATGTRRLSAFLVGPGAEPDLSHSEHAGDEMLYVLDGCISIRFPDRTIRLDAGDSVLFDGHLRHRLSSSDGARALLVVAQDLPARAANGGEGTD